MSGKPYPLSTIARVVGGTRSGSDQRIAHLLIDSRRAFDPEGTLFIALKGPRHDGHHYLEELFDRGVRNFLVMEKPSPGLLERANIIRVTDTLAALQQLAAWHRSHFSYPVIGITGSNGKTIVKEWLFQMLKGEERIIRSPGSWNSQVGVPLSVWEMGPEHTLGIFEAGISQPDEMAKLESIIRPTIGVITNIGSAHDEGFKGQPAQAKKHEKLKLFERAHVWIHPDDISELEGSSSILPGVQGRGWGLLGARQAASDRLNAVHQEVIGSATHVRATYGGSEMEFVIPFTDEASLRNGMSCIAVLLYSGRSAEWINQRLAILEPVDMRLRMLQGAHGTTLIDDSYSMDKVSLGIAVGHLQSVAHGRARVVVISDVPQSEQQHEALYGDVARTLSLDPTNASDETPLRVIGVGPDITAQRDKFPAGSHFYPDTGTLLLREDPKTFAGAVVLIKGARHFRFERIVERWQQQVHGTELEIDLEAIRHNLNHFRSLVAPGVRTMAMVKAFGYGSGSLELARLFEHERVHYLGVAYADEGIELRSHGISMPIMVMNPEPVAMETLHRFRLEAEVYDMRSLQEAIAPAGRMRDAPPVHIKLDTGMHRLGFTEDDLPALLDALRGQHALKVASILSHFVASEDPGSDDFTRAQIASFSRMAHAIGDVLGYRPLWHLANSAGVSRWPQAHFDMVRLGIGLHGIGVNTGGTEQLLHTVRLHTPIAQIKKLKPGDTVGYNRRGVIDSDRTIATLPIGYADGLSRRLGNGVGCVWVNDQRAPIVGNVCMDMCMVDVTGIACTVGDLAVVFDARHRVTEVAQAMGTIPYEVLTSIAQRVKRVYLRG